MVIESIDHLHLLDNGNIIIGNFEMYNSQFDFRGKNNILFCDGSVFRDSYLRFGGDHSVVFFEKSATPLKVETRTGFDSTIYFGKNNYINQKIFLYATERKNIIVGNECLFSFNVYLYTSDPHLLYNFSGKRINQSKSILVGDHVWIGQNSLILKGTKLGSGSVVGGNSVITSGSKKSNCIYAGNPGQKVRSNIYFLDIAANNFDIDRTEQFENDPKCGTENYIYVNDAKTVSIDFIHELLINSSDSQDRLNNVKVFLSDYQWKNRFFIG